MDATKTKKPQHVLHRLYLCWHILRFGARELSGTGITSERRTSIIAWPIGALTRSNARAAGLKERGSSLQLANSAAVGAVIQSAKADFVPSLGANSFARSTGSVA